MTTQAKKPLLPAYLITGTDALKRRTVVERLHKRISQDADLSFNFDEFDGEKAEGDAIVAACNTLPFAAPVRLVQVMAADRLKVADAQAVIDYLSHPNTQTVLCLITTGLAKNTRLYKAVAKIDTTAVIDCAPVKKNQLPAIVSKMAATQGVNITSAAVHALIELVGEDTVALNAQIEKLAIVHRGNDAINENEVRLNVSKTSESTRWDFLDAFSGRNIQKCLAVSSSLEKVSAFSLLALCTTRIRELLIAQSLVRRGQAGSLPEVLRAPQWRVSRHVQWAQNFTGKELRDALASARDLEASMKSGADPDQAFRDWWIAVLALKHR